MERYERQLRLFGEEGQEKIRDSFVAVVGAGGLGSHLIQQLAFLGVGRMAIIDFDEPKNTDLNRLIGIHSDDVSAGIKKVEIAERMIHTVDPSIEVTTVPQDLIHEDSFSIIKRASCVFGCVDNDGARLVLNELCAAFEIPYFDLASDIKNGKELTYGGRVFINSDGNGCLCCYDQISSSQAREDLMSPEARAQEEAIYGVPRQQLAQSGPSVVSINGVIASLAVTEFMVMVVGLRPPCRFLLYYGNKGIVRLNVDKPNADCYYCKSVRGQKDKADVDRYWKVTA